MKELEYFESILDLIERRPQLSRRDFSKAAVIFSSGLLLSSAGAFALSDCDRKPDWKSISFPKILLHNFQLFDGLQNRLQKDRIILIEEDKIQGIERKGDFNRYRDYKAVDLKGWTILPGLIDNHVHITAPFMRGGNVLSQMDQQIEYNFRNGIMSGVNTVRDVGGFPEKINKFKSKVDKNEIPGPRLISSLSMIAARKNDRIGWPVFSPYLKNPIKAMIGGNFAERPTTTREIKEVTEEMIRMGAQWLKTMHHDHTYSFHPRQLPNLTDEGYKVVLEKGPKCEIFPPAGGKGAIVVVASGYSGPGLYRDFSSKLAGLGYYTVLMDGKDLFDPGSLGLISISNPCLSPTVLKTPPIHGQEPLHS